MTATDRPAQWLGIAVMAGMLAHRWWIISKIQATPTWLFLSLAYAVIVVQVARLFLRTGLKVRL